MLRKCVSACLLLFVSSHSCSNSVYITSKSLAHPEALSDWVYAVIAVLVLAFLGMLFGVAFIWRRHMRALRLSGKHLWGGGGGGGRGGGGGAPPPPPPGPINRGSYQRTMTQTMTTWSLLETTTRVMRVVRLSPGDRSTTPTRTTFLNSPPCLTTVSHVTMPCVAASAIVCVSLKWISM
jgi:hypothetical protein